MDKGRAEPGLGCIEVGSIGSDFCLKVKGRGLGAGVEGLGLNRGF